MKKVLYFIMAIVMVSSFAVSANATLLNRGTDTLGNRLIYDDDLDVTWYDFSNAYNFYTFQDAWADTLSVDFEGDIFDDWRLPTTVDGTQVSWSDPAHYDGTGPDGWNITTSEMGHLFYTELGNLGQTALDGTFNPWGSYGLTNTGVFQNLQNWNYWSGTESAVNEPGDVWLFSFQNGIQTNDNKDMRAGLAVRSGDVADGPPTSAIPEPATVALLGIGLAGLAGGAMRRRLKKKAVD